MIELFCWIFVLLACIGIALIQVGQHRNYRDLLAMTRELLAEAKDLRMRNEELVRQLEQL